jgi:hypothetical protein
MATVTPITLADTAHPGRHRAPWQTPRTLADTAHPGRHRAPDGPIGSAGRVPVDADRRIAPVGDIGWFGVAGEQQLR